MKSKEKPPKSLTFFLDRSLGNKVIAKALRENGLSVEIHDDHFSIDAEDETWLNAVGKKGWIVFTKDQYIRYRTNEKIAVRNAKACLFTLISGNLQGKEMASILIKALPKIMQFLQKHNPPFIAKIYKDGSVSLINKKKKRGI